MQKKSRMPMVAVFVLALVTSVSAHAAFSLDQLTLAAKSAVDDFKARNPGHLMHATGYKVWKSDEDAKVKIYVDHDGMPMEFDYACVSAPAVSCTAQ